MKGWFSENMGRRFMRLSMFTILPVIFGSAMAYASGGGEEGGSKALWIDFAWRMVNFAILVWFLYWISANKIKAFFPEGVKASRMLWQKPSPRRKKLKKNSGNTPRSLKKPQRKSTPS